MTLGELLGNFAKHYTDMEIDRSQTCRDADGTSRDFARAINIYNSLFAKNSDGSTSSFNNALLETAEYQHLFRNKVSEQVLSLALLRSCRLLQQNKKGKENRITASLAGITKAFLIRNYGENMTMGLNSNNTSPAYITGRIFAHMESAQRKIDPNNQTTYAKRFFERVMMNPAKTMPELHKSFLLLKNKAKANGMRGLYNSSDKKIMALIDMLDGNYPDHLSEKQKVNISSDTISSEAQTSRMPRRRKTGKPPKLKLIIRILRQTLQHTKGEVTMSELVKNPITIVLAFDAQNCNPNGDPDNDNNPRQFEDGIGYMSSESIKYKIRSYIRDKVLFDGLEKEQPCTILQPRYFFPLSAALKSAWSLSSAKKSKASPITNSWRLIRSCAGTTMILACLGL